MIRTKNKKPISYNQSDEPIVLSKPLLDILLSQDKPSDLIALYSFYYYMAKWQKTNQPYSTTGYTAKGLGWTTERVRKNKKILKKLELIDDIDNRDEQGKVRGHYIKVNFIWTREKASQYHPIEKPPYGLDHTMGNQGINALSSNNKNALSSNNKIPPDKKQDKPIPYLHLAEQLSTTIQSNKNIRHTQSQIKSWARELQRFVDQSGVSIERIEKALDWYSEHIGEKYVPVIESGKSLREKFIKLEAAMERDIEVEWTASPKDILEKHFSRGSYKRWMKYCFNPLIELLGDRGRSNSLQNKIALALCELRTWYTSKQKIPNLTGREGDEIYGRWQSIPDAFGVVEEFIKWLGDQHWIGEIYPMHLHPEGAVFQQFLTGYQKEVGLDFFDGSSK